MARRVIKKVQLAAVVAFLLDGIEEQRDRPGEALRAAQHAARQVNELALTRAIEERQDLLARTIEALKIARTTTS